MIEHYQLLIKGNRKVDNREVFSNEANIYIYRIYGKFKYTKQRCGSSR